MALLLVAETALGRVAESAVYLALPPGAVWGPGFKSRRPDQTFQTLDSLNVL